MQQLIYYWGNRQEAAVFKQAGLNRRHIKITEYIFAGFWKGFDKQGQNTIK